MCKALYIVCPYVRFLANKSATLEQSNAAHWPTHQLEQQSDRWTNQKSARRTDGWTKSGAEIRSQRARRWLGTVQLRRPKRYVFTYIHI